MRQMTHIETFLQVGDGASERNERCSKPPVCLHSHFLPRRGGTRSKLQRGGALATRCVWQQSTRSLPGRAATIASRDTFPCDIRTRPPLGTGCKPWIALVPGRRKYGERIKLHAPAVLPLENPRCSAAAGPVRNARSGRRPPPRYRGNTNRYRWKDH